MTRKVLVAMHPGDGIDKGVLADPNRRTNYDLSIHTIVAMLKGLGYEPEPRLIYGRTGATTTELSALTRDNYHFAVAPCTYWNETWRDQNGDEYQKMFDGTMNIPTFIFGLAWDQTSQLMYTCGAWRYSTLGSKGFHKTTWTKHGLSMYAHACDYEITTRQWIVDRSHDDPQDPHYTPLQTTEAGGVKSWILHGANSNVYCDSGANTISASLIAQAQWFILLQEAIDRGDITELPRKKLPVMFDLDDFPHLGDTPRNTLEDMEAFYDLQQRYGLPVTLGLQTLPTANWDRHTQKIVDFIAARTADKGGLIYPIEHGNSLYADEADAAACAALYESEADKVTAAGISHGRTADGYDAWGYRYFNTNNFDNKFLDAVVDNGYGIKVVRASDTSRNQGMGEPYITQGVRQYRGIRVLGSGAPWGSTTWLDPDNEETLMQQFSREFLCTNPIWGRVTYLHGENFFFNHDSGGNPDTWSWPGGRALEECLAIAVKCPDILALTHPSALAVS